MCPAVASPAFALICTAVQHLSPIVVNLLCRDVVIPHLLLSEMMMQSLALQVRHTADEVGAGETVILTLADKGVLDEEDGDELENVLAVSSLMPHAFG